MRIALREVIRMSVRAQQYYSNNEALSLISLDLVGITLEDEATITTLNMEWLVELRVYLYIPKTLNISEANAAQFRTIPSAAILSTIRVFRIFTGYPCTPSYLHYDFVDTKKTIAGHLKRTLDCRGLRN